MQKTVNLLRGFVRIAVECPYPERFINLCAYNNVAFWSVERVDAVRLEATIAASGLDRAGELASRLGGTLSPLGRRGALFFLERFRRRYALIAGLFACLAALFVSNRYIWEFTVEGNAALSDEIILQALRESGVSTGSPASSVDIETVRNQMLIKLGKLSWITVNVTGSHAAVVVRERAEKPEIFSRHTPVNIVAEKAGLITRLDTLSGSAQVFPGDTVWRGQLLVSGLVDSAQVGVRLVNARADVTARTWTELRAVVPTGAVGKRYTGRSKTRYALLFGGRRVNLYGNASQPYAMCDKMIKTETLRAPQNVAFPVALVRETFMEYEPVSYQMDEEVARDALRQALGGALRGGLGRGEILTESVTFHMEPGLVTAVLTAECLERIDMPRKIDLAEAMSMKNP
ncbi:MAG: sporulation protein YqfD [Oscillospiraceae bacterium]|jgi:similar to stage IV sporulation protein|nr:sporulation protein YqfD [Oscillospiraceae bacterium]